MALAAVLYCVESPMELNLYYIFLKLHNIKLSPTLVIICDKSSFKFNFQATNFGFWPANSYM